MKGYPSFCSTENQKPRKKETVVEEEEELEFDEDDELMENAQSDDVSNVVTESDNKTERKSDHSEL